MAEQDPILLGLSGATFLLTAETGGIIQSYSRRTQRQVIDVYNGAVGYTTGSVFHDPSANYTVRIITTGNTGIAAAAPGTTLSIANTSTGNGVSSGGIYTTSTSLDHNGGALREFSAEAIQRPGIA